MVQSINVSLVTVLGLMPSKAHHKHCSFFAKALIKTEFSEEGDLEQALSMVRSSRAIPRTHELAETFARESRESIAWLPDSSYKRALLELPDFVLSRLS